ncbi:MAG TPA: hypothetical protein VFM50_11915 [Nocardioidaceae bacterium]|jgi:hypothetical protein|nr:hypothetical protein [Marmoricola sp.]HET8718445.1 hypothetical protein [Nocardioidaceae bacterium]
MTLRALTAAGVLVSGLVHLYLWVDGFRDVSVVGPLFLLNAVAGVVLAIAVMTWRHWIPLFVAAGFGASTLGAFVISATVGLFGVQEVFWGTWQVIAAVAEIVAVVAGLAALWQENPALQQRLHRSQPSHLRAHPR